MSFSNPNSDRPTNPSARFLEWSSKLKSWKYYDKEKKENIPVSHDMKFIPLDQLTTVTGYNSSEQKSLYANEVRSLDDKLIVKCDRKIVAEGVWAEVKDSNRYAKFATSLYALATIDGKRELVNMKLSGAALSEWIEFTKEFRKTHGKPPHESGVILKVDEIKHGVNGATEFYSPVFTVFSKDLEDSVKDEAIAADTILQEYLDKYLRLDHSRVPSEELDHDKVNRPQREVYTPPPVTDDDDEIPF